MNNTPLIIDNVAKDRFPLQEIEKHTLLQALSLFNPYGSKQNTLFDAVIATLAQQLHADAIFSFDGWYRKIGLTLASDLTLQSKEAA